MPDLTAKIHRTQFWVGSTLDAHEEVTVLHRPTDGLGTATWPKDMWKGYGNNDTHTFGPKVTPTGKSIVILDETHISF